MIEARFGNAYFWDSLLMVAWTASALFLAVLLMLPTVEVMSAFVFSLMSLFIMVTAWRVIGLWYRRAARTLVISYVLSVGTLYWVGVNRGVFTMYIAGAVVPSIMVTVVWSLLVPARCCQIKHRRRPILIRGSYKLAEQT